MSSADREKILASARDYIEGWLDGDADRMARCMHLALIKREALADDPSAASITRDQMVEATQAGRGTKLERPYSVKLLDAFGDIATVSVFSSAYMDYLHLARSGDEWLLLNVLWQRRTSSS